MIVKKSYVLGMSTSSLPGPMESGELEGRKEADYCKTLCDVYGEILGISDSFR
jgi:hypothetical protein